MGLSNGDEDIARNALESLVELAEFCPQFYSDQLEPLLDSMFKLASDRNWEDNTRFSALEFFLTLCESRPSAIKKLPKELTKFVSLMLNMITQLEENEKWNEGPVCYLTNFFLTFFVNILYRMLILKMRSINEVWRV